MSRNNRDEDQESANRLFLASFLLPSRPCILVPVEVVRVKSYVDSLLNSTRLPVRVSVNELNFVPERIMPGLIGVFRNGRSLSS